MVFKGGHKPVAGFLLREVVNENIVLVGRRGGVFCPDR